MLTSSFRRYFKCRPEETMTVILAEEKFLFIDLMLSHRCGAGALPRCTKTISVIKEIYPYNLIMHVRNIPSNLWTYSKRAALWRSNSSPYLSGDLFADTSDIGFFTPTFRSSRFRVNDIKSAMVVFCPSHEVERLFQEYGEDIRAKVVILGNSDRDFSEPLPEIPSSVRVVFCQNLLFKHPLYEPLPIGVENLKLGTNGLTNLFSDKYSFVSKEEKILVGPLSDTHRERSEIFDKIYSDQAIHFADQRLSPREYAKLAAKFRFIASPRGNGQDTHRFWETLYRGGIPIVKSNIWTQKILELGIPLLETPGWTEKELLESIKSYSKNAKKFRDIPQLWWPWWEARIKSYLSS